MNLLTETRVFEQDFIFHVLPALTAVGIPVPQKLWSTLATSPKTGTRTKASRDSWLVDTTSKPSGRNSWRRRKGDGSVSRAFYLSCWFEILQMYCVGKRKDKHRFVQRIVVRTSPLRCSGVDHTVLPANNTTPAYNRSSPGGATTEWTVIAPAHEAYYSFIDPMRMKGWVGLVGWPTADGLPI